MATKLQSFYCLCCVLLLISTTTSSDKSCKSLSSLVEALYSTDNNLFQLASVFYPLRRSPAIYVTVTYQFVDEAGTLDDCKINYIWASSSFLLVQPPHVFQWTSLLFYHQSANEDDDIILTLPAACRDLVPDCSCNNQNEDNLLHFMTHQVIKTIHVLAWHRYT